MISSVGASLSMIAGVTFGIQGAAYLFSLRRKTEKYFDIMGATNYAVNILLGLFVRFQSDSVPQLVPRQALAGALTLVWSIRLGSFLFLRILRHGKDSRFDELKSNALSWSIPWISSHLDICYRPTCLHCSRKQFFLRVKPIWSIRHCGFAPLDFRVLY